MGGLGNQLFQYAAGRAMALRNDAELKLDVLSGFAYDDIYHRAYCLKHFNIVERFASPFESYMKTMGRFRRVVARRASRYFPRAEYLYVRERSDVFDSRITGLVAQRVVYVDGLWQNTGYFRDIENELRKELQIKTPHDELNMRIAGEISGSNAVSIHIRRLFRLPGSSTPQPVEDSDNIPGLCGRSYYQKAINRIADSVSNPHFYVFSDYPEWARKNLEGSFPMTFITHNGEEKYYEDFWLVSKCKHHIIANSTFSWWAAWLSAYPEKRVIAPAICKAFSDEDLPGWDYI